MEIVKGTGERERFEEEKLYISLKRAGAPSDLARGVVREVRKLVKPDMRTEDIFRAAFKILRRENICAAARYRLKRGIMELGPAGFLFEQYFGAVLESYGYATRCNQMVRGECVEHEIDVIAMKERTCFLVEAKYHNGHDVQTDSKTIMYSYARLLDIAPGYIKRHGEDIECKAWLVTNTRFTDRAKQYGLCRGIKMTGWGYPEEGSLQDMIESKILHPVTVLPSMDRALRERLAAKKLFFAKDLASYAPERFEREFGLKQRKAVQIVGEAQALFKGIEEYGEVTAAV